MPPAIDSELYTKKIDALRCCVIIPTYNNERTLAQVIRDVQAFTPNIIVVNDGSTDSTQKILDDFTSIHIISYTLNKGKGSALRTGLKFAEEMGFRYAITIDSDGQHYADDLSVFIERIEQEPDSFLVGSRNLTQENMPRKNTFGNKFSNFWFRFETGIKLPDTQSGYRLYPIDKLKGIRFFTTKYEFEVEVLVKAAWKEINIIPVPVRVYYAEKEDRVSHFRPRADFTRISILNTYLVTLALFWYKPIYFFKNFRKENIKAFVKVHFLDLNESPLKKSMGVAFGVFMGIIPIWGYQLITAIVLAHFLKLNKAIVALAANISVPPMIPFLLYGSLKTGQWVLGHNLNQSIFDAEITLEVVKLHLYEYIVGSVVFGVVMAVLLGLISYYILRKYEKRSITT